MQVIIPDKYYFLFMWCELSLFNREESKKRQRNKRIMENYLFSCVAFICWCEIHIIVKMSSQKRLMVKLLICTDLLFDLGDNHVFCVKQNQCYLSQCRVHYLDICKDILNHRGTASLYENRNDLGYRSYIYITAIY